MVKMTRRMALLGLVSIAVVTADASYTGPTRPVLLVFPSGQNTIVPATSTQDTKKITDLDRMYLAARAVRAMLNDEAAVDAILFDMEQPTILRAVLESKIGETKTELNEEQKVKIAATFGATHIVSVNALSGTLNNLRAIGDQVQTFNSNTANLVKAAGKGKADPKKSPLQPSPIATDNSNAPSLSLTVLTVTKGKVVKRWEQTVQLGDDENTSIGDLVNTKGVFPNSWASAARSLVLKFLNDNLKDARMAAVDRSLLPPQNATPPTVREAAPVVTISQEAEAAALTMKGKTFISEGQIQAGLRLLREAVNYAPLHAAPRIALAEAYATVGRIEEASAEVKRARRLVPTLSADEDAVLSAVLIRGLAASTDPEDAKNAYIQILRDKPEDIVTRLHFAELLIKSNDLSAAEVQYRIIRKKDPSNVYASVGFAQIVAARSDMDEALRELMTIESESSRHAFGTTIFTILASITAERLTLNRRSWEQGTLSREALYTATNALSQRATQLLALLTLSPPTKATESQRLVQHRRRVFAGNLLAQATTSLLSYLESGESTAGVRSKSQAEECLTELKLLAPTSEIPPPILVRDAVQNPSPIKVGPPPP